MLLPRKTKHRKQFRGRRAGVSRGQTTVQFGDYGIKALEDGWITTAATRAVRASAANGQGHALAEVHQTIGHSIRETNALNLDRRLTLLQAFDLIEQARRA
mgnify:CR=1 FL=1